MAQRDYYDLLGVPRDADERTIKKAFRALARELHPDVSDDPAAEERFREVAEAYEVLSKPDTRELYDRYGHEGLRTGGFRPTDFNFGNLSDLLSTFFGDDLFGGLSGARRSRRGGDVLAEIEIELADAASGVKREVPFAVAVTCRGLHGKRRRAGLGPGDVSAVQRGRPAAADLPQRLRRVRACPALPALPWRGANRRRALSELSRARDGSPSVVRSRSPFPPGSTMGSGSDSRARGTWELQVGLRATPTSS